MRFYKIKSIPKKYNQTTKELEKLVNQYNPVDILVKKFFKRPIHSSFVILIEHKPIDKIAKFYKNEIIVDFRNSPKYLWLCLCHETTHILFRVYDWKKSEIYKILKENYPKEKNMIYSVDQACAILLQAYCENILKIRSLQWKSWESTFDYMDTKEIAGILWPKFLNYIKKKDNVPILKWLEKLEKKKYFVEL